MSFFPLDRDIITSSVWVEPYHVRCLWLYLLVSADRMTGIVHESEPIMAARAIMPIDDLRSALSRLSEPDPISRTKDNDGRRVAILSDGIHILNYERYRDKDYSTPRVRRFRKRDETECNAVKRHETTDTDTDTDTDRELIRHPPAGEHESALHADRAARGEPPLGADQRLAVAWREYQLSEGPDGYAAFVRGVHQAEAAGTSLKAILSWCAGNRGRHVYEARDALVAPPPRPARPGPEDDLARILKRRTAAK